MFEHLYRLRNNAVRKENGKLKLLLANFSGSKQKIDIEKRNPVIEDFFRIKIDVKPWREKEDTRKDNLDFDWSSKENIMSSMTGGSCFDMPSWVLYAMKGKKGEEALCRDLNDYCEVFIYQLKACNIHCVYCFVDDFNKNGKEDNSSRFFSVDEIADEFEKENIKREKEGIKNKLYRIRASGGEPTIAAEQWLYLLQELEKRGLSDKVHLQSDTNLTTGHFIDLLEGKGEVEKNIFEKIAKYRNFGLLCSFKGTDRESFHKNTLMNPDLFNEHLYSFKKIVKAGIDAYPFLYNPNPATLESFLENLSREVGENVYLKTWVLPLKVYEPVKERLAKKGIDSVSYEKQLDDNFLKSEEKMQEILQRKFGVDYKKHLRTGIALKVDEKSK